MFITLKSYIWSRLHLQIVHLRVALSEEEFDTSGLRHGLFDFGSIQTCSDGEECLKDQATACPNNMSLINQFVSELTDRCCHHSVPKQQECGAHGVGLNSTYFH